MTATADIGYPNKSSNNQQQTDKARDALQDFIVRRLVHMAQWGQDAQKMQSLHLLSEITGIIPLI